MAKDPAFLFYSSDFRSGTIHFTDEQVGQYIRLLCDQHQIGHLPELHMLNICKSQDSPVFKKFNKDSEGAYFNERLEFEINKRISFCESRRNNVNKRYKDTTLVDTSVSTYVPTTDLHIENENRNDNVLKDKAKKVIEYLNVLTDKAFRFSDASLGPIAARLKEGFTVEDCKKVIENKMLDPYFTDNPKYMCPTTLFRPSNFEKYLNEKTKINKTPAQIAQETYERQNAGT